MHEIKIYGEVIPYQDEWITEQGGYVNLSSVQKQLAEAGGKDVKVRINCIGGDVDEGFAIYSELRRYAKENKVNVSTLAEGRCASIATVIFLAGDSRVVTEYTEPFVHNAWCYTMGDSKNIMKVGADLEKCNEKIARHYEAHTDLTYDEARELMDNETSITAAECLSMRFATEIEEVLRPVALQRFTAKPTERKNLNTNKMSNKNQKKGLMAKFEAFFKQFSNKEVYTADQRVLDFYELEEDEPIEVGANATIDGEPADGEIVMENGDTYVFANGVLEEIREKAEETDDTEMEALQAKIAEQEATIAELQNKLTASNKKNADMMKAMKEIESEIEVDDPKPASGRRNIETKAAKASKGVTSYINNTIKKTK